MVIEVMVAQGAFLFALLEISIAPRVIHQRVSRSSGRARVSKSPLSKGWRQTCPDSPLRPTKARSLRGPTGAGHAPQNHNSISSLTSPCEGFSFLFFFIYLFCFFFFF